MAKRRQRVSAPRRGAKAGSKTASRRRVAAAAIQQPGVVPVVMAVAASATRIKVDSSRPSLTTTPKNLLDLRFNDARVGLKTAAQLENWRRNLSQLLPQVPGVETLSVTPSTVIADAVTQVSQMLAAAPPAAAPIVMALGVVEEARKKVADRLGREFATKSSAALVSRLTAPAREAFGAPAVVLEFAEQTAAPPLPARASSRTQRIASRRDAFYRVCSEVRAAVEKASGLPSVEVCWLNSTMRVAGPVTAVADVAGHKDVQVLDVPRLMRREMNVAGGTVRAAAARDTFGVSGNGVRVAVIDGEVNVAHPAFGGRATLQENLTSEALGGPDPHGTAVAGIIAAADAQFAGIAPGALVMNYKVFPTGSVTGDEFEGILAIEHALRDGADVANCSWGIGGAGDGTNREARALNRAWEEGLVIVKSAGNAGPGANSLTSPADADGIIVVGATEREGTTVQDYSSRGPTANQKHPHLVVPGGTLAVNIVTCLPAAAGGFGNVGFGTSLAAPIVAGAAALVREKFPVAGADEIRNRLLNMCRKIGNDVNASGAGLLDLSLFSLV